MSCVFLDFALLWRWNDKFWQKTFKSNFGRRRLIRLFSNMSPTSNLFYFDTNFYFQLLWIWNKLNDQNQVFRFLYAIRLKSKDLYPTYLKATKPPRVWNIHLLPSDQQNTWGDNSDCKVSIYHSNLNKLRTKLIFFKLKIKACKEPKTSLN